MDVLGRGGAQNPAATPNRHVFPQSDFGGHGKSQFHDRAFRERRLGVKENSTASQILSKSGYCPSIEVKRQRQVHFETLRASSFQTMFNTIRIGAHRPSLPDPVRGSVTSAQRTSTLSRIGPRGKFQMGGGPGFHDSNRKTLHHQGHEVSRRLSVSVVSFVYLRALGG